MADDRRSGDDERPSRIQRALALFADKEVPGLYGVGYRHRLISFYSQQTRALNFLWALLESGLAEPGQTMVVVGAGISGMTAGIAAAISGLKVTIVDHAPAWIGNIRFASHRYMHPRMAYWPAPNWDDPVADFPVLGWHAMYADRLWRWFDHQIRHYQDKLKGALEIVRPVRVEEIVREEERWRVKLRKRRDNILAHHVLLALGPGHEPRQYGSRRYWDADATALDARAASRAVLISGTGDGGLIDAIRYALFDKADAGPINHRAIIGLLDFVDDKPFIAPLRERLGSALFQRDPYAAYVCKLAIDELADALAQKVQTFPDPPCTVVLQSRAGIDGLYTRGAAAPLHQALTLAVDRSAGGVRRLHIEDGDLSSRAWEPVLQAWSAKARAPVHEIVIRHGTANPLSEFLESKVKCSADVRRALLRVANQRGDELEPPRLFDPGYFTHASRPAPRWDSSEWPATLADLWLATRTFVLDHGDEAELSRAPMSGDNRSIATCMARPRRLTWLWPALGDRRHPNVDEVARTEKITRYALTRLIAVAGYERLLRARGNPAGQGSTALAEIEYAESRGSLCRHHQRIVLPIAPARSRPGAKPPPPLRDAGSPSALVAYRMICRGGYDGVPRLRVDAARLSIVLEHDEDQFDPLSISRSDGRWIVTGEPIALPVAPILVLDIVAFWHGARKQGEPHAKDRKRSIHAAALRAIAVGDTAEPPRRWARRLGADLVLHLDDKDAPAGPKCHPFAIIEDAGGLLLDLEDHQIPGAPSNT